MSFVHEFWPLKSTKALHSSSRIPALDVLRGIAILLVVLFHIRVLPYGYLGVDLFFVISGFLIGGLLVESYLTDSRISYFRFILSRGFKIWPSYLVFIVLGEVLALLMYGRSRPGEIIPLSDLPMYLLLYRNYRGHPHWTFDHVWSLCVEEHFYLLLPLIFVFAGKLLKVGMKFITIGVVLMLLAGIFGKVLGYQLHIDTFAATHNRLDALAVGVLLFIARRQYGLRVTSWQVRLPLLVLAFSALTAAIAYHYSIQNPIFNNAIFHALTPLCFAVLILSLLDLDLSKLSLMRTIGYYSYNWYLWHPLFVYLFLDHMRPGLTLVFAYLAVTFLVAMLFTVLVEEPFLLLRKPFLNKIFTGKSRSARANSGHLSTLHQVEQK
jgi:peptidoglycan/LPS O-acetylase OafA/YrhL